MTTDGSGQNVQEQEIEKTVQIVAYLDYPRSMTLRQIAEDMFPDTDWFDRRTYETTDDVVHVGDMTYSIDQDLREALEEVDTGEAVPDVITETKSRYKVKTNKMTKKFMRHIKDKLPPMLLGEYELNDFTMDYENGDGDKCIKVFRYVDDIPVLKEPDKIEPDDRFVDDVDRPAMKFKVRAYADSEEEMEELQVMYIDHLVDVVGNESSVDLVRWTNCKRKETTEGSCINI